MWKGFGQGTFGTMSQLGRIAVADDPRDMLLWLHRHELQNAHDVQRQILPNRCPVTPGFEISAASTPAREVGGDYFNFHWAGHGTLGIVMADVSGKGLPAALIATLLAATFRSQTWGNRDVCNLLSRVNDFIAHGLRPGTFVTCTYGLLNLATSQFTLARAGHEPTLIARASGEIESLAPFGFALGVLDGREFRESLETQTVQLERGDRLLMFTDGLTEAMNAQGDEFGMERILETLRNAPLEEAGSLQPFERDIQSFCASEPLHDDLSLMLLTVK